MPRARRSDDGCVGTERSEADLGPFVGYLSAIAPDFAKDTVEKEPSACHHAATQHDHFGAEDGDEVCQAETQIMRFALHAR